MSVKETLASSDPEHLIAWWDFDSGMITYAFEMVQLSLSSGSLRHYDEESSLMIYNQ